MTVARLGVFSKAGAAGLCLALALSSCATPAAHAPAAARAQEPGWVSGGPHERFSGAAYLTAVGSGGTRQAAELDAFRQLAGAFGVSVQADTRLAEVYRRTGAVATHEVAFGQEIILGTDMDNLIGAEIGDRWEAGRGPSFALAVLNRERAALIYSEMIRANLEMIDALVGMPAAQRNSMDGFSRYRFAAVIADMNSGYAAVLAVVGSPAQPMRSGDDFRRAAQEIAAAIPVGINVDADRAGRLQGAFARAFTDLGFRTGGAGNRYVLNVGVVLLPTDHAGQTAFARMELSANLVQADSGEVLLPFTFSVREGHRTQSEAENRAFMAAEQRIDREYADMLCGHLSRLIPGR